jgi:hypothetical protein
MATRHRTRATLSAEHHVQYLRHIVGLALFRDELHFSEVGHAALAGVLWPRLRAFVQRNDALPEASR